MDPTSIYLGPLGSMVELPPFEGGMRNPLAAFGAIHESLTGKRTVHARGFRLSWDLRFPYLTETEYGFLEACRMLMTPRPLRIIDPTRKNRLSATASSGHSWNDYSRSSPAFSTTSGVVLPDAWQVLPTDIYLSHTAKWTVTSAGVLKVDAERPVPAIPGETVTLSAYVYGLVPVNLRIVALAKSGAMVATLDGSSVNPNPGTWVTLSYTVPAGVSSLRPELVTAATSGDVYSTAWQLETGTARTAWVPGMGCPEVYISSLTPSHPESHLVDVDVTILEL